MTAYLKVHLIAQGPFTPASGSLRSFTCPDWFRDAKFGIWSHWGPQVVPEQGDWYARHMYIQGTPQYNYHLRKYGHPSKFGYKDIIALWKAEKFDPEGLMNRFVDSGARYFVAQANHHDNFDNWNSKHHRWNSVAAGPRRDIVGEWKKAARKHLLPFGVSEHLSASYNWFVANKVCDSEGPYAGVPYDGSDPAFQDLYYPYSAAEIEEARRVQACGERLPWYTANPWFIERWFLRMMDLIDQHEPDLLYFDGPLPFDETGRHIVAHLFNVSAKKRGRNSAMFTQKDQNYDVTRIGVFDIEKGQSDAAEEHPWQCCSWVANWFDDVRAPFKTPRHVVETLVDIVAKNGNLLLNIIQLPDGSVNEEAGFLLDHIGGWTRTNGEGIYGTRPWVKAAEGPSLFQQKVRFEEKPMEWISADFRFRAKGNAVYAFQMKYADERCMYIRSLGRAAGAVKSVELLGSAQPVTFRQLEDCLFVKLPADKVCEFVPCAKVVLDADQDLKP